MTNTFRTTGHAVVDVGLCHGHDCLSVGLRACAQIYTFVYIRSNATSVASAAINTIAVTVELKIGSACRAGPQKESRQKT